MPTEELYDLLIIGGGPSGMAAAFWAWRRGKRAMVLEMHEELGGQVTRLWPDKIAYDLPGYARVRGGDFVQELTRQAFLSPLAENLGNNASLPDCCVGHEAVRMKRYAEDGMEFFVVTAEKLRFSGGEAVEVLGETKISARAILITAGIGASAPRTFEEPHLARFAGHGLEYVVRTRDPYCNKDVLIIGGGDSAVDWTHQLGGMAKSVTLVHRRKEFRASEQMILHQLIADGVVRVPYVLDEIVGDTEVSGAWIKNTETGERECLPVNAILACLGQPANLSVFETWGLEMHDKHIRVETRFVDGVPLPCYTNIPGIYAAGEATDVRTQLIAFDMALAGLAALAALHDLCPNEKLFPQYSSSATPKK